MAHPPSHALARLLDAADALHALGLPGLVLTFSSNDVACAGTERTGAHRPMAEWITTAHGQLGLAHHTEILLDAARTFHHAVRTHPNLRDLLGSGRLDILWQGRGTRLVWCPDGHVDRTIRYSTWPAHGNRRRVLAGVREAERLDTGARHPLTLFDPLIGTAAATVRSTHPTIHALAPLLQARAPTLPPVTGHQARVFAAETVARDAQALRQRKVPLRWARAFDGLMAALGDAPAAVSNALVEQRGAETSLRLRVGSERFVWPHRKKGARTDATLHAPIDRWASGLLEAWATFWGTLEQTRPALAHRDHLSPRRLSLLRGREGPETWIDLLGTGRLTTHTDMAPLLAVTTGRVRLVALGQRRQVACLPAPSARTAAAVAWALAAPGRAADAHTTVWDRL